MAKKYKDPSDVKGLKRIYTTLKLDYDAMPSFAPAKEKLKTRLAELNNKIKIAEAIEENKKTPLKKGM